MTPVDPEQTAPAQLNCSRPAIERFPATGLTQQQRRHGGVIIFIIGALYCFLGLAIVCDDYFVPALEVSALVVVIVNPGNAKLL